MIAFGPLFFAWPLAVFGFQHFVFLHDVMNAVPPWLPGHVFWTVFVGIALVAASLSITTGIKAELAALMAGVMLLLFVLLIYVPGALQSSGERITVTLLLRDLSLSGGALALAGTYAAKGRWRRAGWIAVVGRYFFAIAMGFFGVQSFLHPDSAPGVPLEMNMPPWLPLHILWAYATGAILVACSVAMLLNWRARLAAAVVGIAFVVLVICIYMPMEIVHPSIEISGELDYVADTLAIGGAALLVAGAIARKPARAFILAKTPSFEVSHF